MPLPAQTEEASPFAVVDGVSEPGGVHDGQLQLHALLLDVHRVLGDLHRLADSLCGSETQSRSAAFHRVSGRVGGVGSTADSPSALSSFRSLCRSVRNRLFTSVDLPKPDSPENIT